jgi:putative membrane protein
MRLFQLYALLILPWLAACSGGESNKDPVAEAKFQNEKRIGDEAVTEKQERDAEFMVTAASSSMTNLEISQIAQRKATSPDVKYLAQMIVGEHGNMQADLKSLAQKKSIVLPTNLGENQAKIVGELTALNGAGFDRKYLDLLEDIHKNSVDEFDDLSEDAYDGDIRAFAAKYLPVLKKHREAAEQAADKLPKQ